MNLLHMKYVVTVADMGSINKAAEELLVAQPNVSRSIKELEADLGISIFHRTSKGMTLTPEGAEFIGYARNISQQTARRCKADGSVDLNVESPDKTLATEKSRKCSQFVARGKEKSPEPVENQQSRGHEVKK